MCRGRRLSVVIAVAAVAVAWAAAAFLAGPAQADPAGAEPAIGITSPRAYQVVQRGDDNRADIVVRGHKGGFAGPLEVRWGAGPWVRVQCRRHASFRVRLKGCPAGQATLVVRSVRRPSLVVRRPWVGVGDIYVVAGQSNASGRGLSLARASHPSLRASLFGNDDRWKSLADPTDSPAGQRDAVSADRAAGGSVWPLVATDLMRSQGVPVAFIPCAKGTTAIARWLRDAVAPSARTTLYGSMLRRIRAAGGRVRAVVFWQGERDARILTPGPKYEEALTRLAADVRADFGAPLVVANIGDYCADRYTRGGIDSIRLAQQAAWRTSPDVAPGPLLYDIDLGGDVHVRGSADQRTAARRWAAAILAGLHGMGTQEPPRLVDAVYDGATTVTLAFDCGAGGLVPGPAEGFALRSLEGSVPLRGAVALADGTLVLMLDEPVPGPLWLSLGSGRDGAGRLVPRNSLGGAQALVAVGVPIRTAE
jgi:hypothetical protein